MPMRSHVLITVEELRAAEATILDASWIYPPLNHGRIDVRQRYAAAHIPGSWFLDLASLSDPAGRYDPRVEVMTPPRPEELRAAMAAAGAGASSLIVVTDMDGGCTTAPFARHALIHAGFTEVRLLDGGTPAWRRGGVGLTEQRPRYLDAVAIRHPLPSAVERTGSRDVFADYDMIRRALQDRKSAQIVDCRAERSNEGLLPPDYVGLEIPAPVHVPSSCVVEPADDALRYKREAELRAILKDAGVSPRGLKITTCYFGLGASVVSTALEIAAFAPILVYPGSLVEYAVKEKLVQL